MRITEKEQDENEKSKKLEKNNKKDMMRMK